MKLHGDAAIGKSSRNQTIRMLSARSCFIYYVTFLSYSFSYPVTEDDTQL